MTSKIVVNNIGSDTGINTVTFDSNVQRGSSNLHSTGLNVNNTFVHSTGIALGAGSTVGAVTGVTTYYGDGSQLTGINSDVVSDTSPQLGGNLDVNSKNIVFGDSGGATDDRLTFGASNDLQLFHAAAGISTIMHYHSGGEPLHITSNGDIKFKVDANSSGTGGEDGLIVKSNGAVQLYHDNRLRAYTVSNGFYAEQGEVNDDFDLLIANKYASLSNNQRCALTCRVTKDAGGSHGGTNRSAVFGHMYNASTGGGGYFNIRSNDGTNRDFYMDNNTNLRVNYGPSNIGTTNGTVVGSQGSDIRNKNLVGDGTVPYGLSEVLQLNPIRYQFKKELVNRIGFSAQQVEPIIPESVYDTGIKST